jgi:DNA repair exonuclease SbcCD ATPase subunit
LKINRLTIENFRNHKRTEITLDKINFFVGGNNAGKTSILAAIEWALTGRCMWTDRAGRGAADLVRQGEKIACAVLEVDGLGAVIRSLPPHTLQAGRTAGVNEGQAAIQNFLDADEERLKVALNASAFMAMSPAEQRTMLFTAYGLAWTTEKVAAELATWLISNKHRDDDVLRLAKRASGYYPAGITCGPEIFDAMEKRAKEERREVKKDKQRAEAALVEIADTPGQAPVSGQADELKVRLIELSRQRDDLLRFCGAGGDLKARRETLLQKINDADGRIARWSEVATSCEAELAQLGEVPPDASDEEDAVLDKIDLLGKKEIAIKSRLAAVNKAGEALAGAGRKCPLAPDHLQCGLTKEQLEALLNTLRQERKLVGQELKNCASDLEKAYADLEKVRDRQEEHREKTMQAERIESNIISHRETAERLQEEKVLAENELNGLPQAEDSAGAEKELARVTALVRECEESLARLVESGVMAEKRTVLQQDIETYTADLADLEILVKALGPDGLRRDRLAGILDGFVGRVNDRLGRLTEGSYQISLGADMEILCRVNGGPVLPLKLLSKSEQLRVGITASEALSAAAGLKFLAIDEADMLEQDNRDLLAGMLLDTASEFDQVMVFTTVGEIQPENPGIPGVKMFQVNEGIVREI